MPSTEARLVYAGGQLDRAAARRGDTVWLNRNLERHDCSVVPVWQNRNLLQSAEVNATGPRPQIHCGERAREILAAAPERIFLGQDGSRPYFAADLSNLDEAAATALVVEGEFVDLRQVGPTLPRPEAALLAYARGICHWHRRHLFCGRCGAATESELAGHQRRCASPVCRATIHPRIDPAVIMLVEVAPKGGQPGRCLLGNHKRLPPGTYTTLAGFVEPGESLEEAVAREVAEEAAIEVEAVRYCASQPWPFPSSIMLGFRARAGTMEITVDEEELTEARWFTAAEVAGFGEWGDESDFRLPRRDSIARYLVDSWLADRKAAGEL